MMLNLREFREAPDRLSDLLPFAALVASDVALNKDGSFLSVIEYRGNDLDSSTDSELTSVTGKLNHVLKSLGSGYALFIEARREKQKEYPENNFPDALSYLIDEERRVLFSSEDHFESRYFLSICFLPESDQKKRANSLLFEETGSAGGGYKEALKSFRAEVKRIVGALESTFREASVLKDGSLLSFLHSTVSERAIRVGMPDTPMYLDSVLGDSALITGSSPKLGGMYLGALSIKSFPAFSEPGLLDSLNSLSFSYRWVTRFIPLGKEEAERELKKYKRKWFAKRKGVLTLLKEVVSGQESIMSDSDAVRKAEDAEGALRSLGGDEVSFGFMTQVVLVMDLNKDGLQKKLERVRRVINSKGFVTRIEDLNTVDAWLGTVPGNTRNNVRRPILSTNNLAHLMPVSALWAGPKKNFHLNDATLMYCRTGGSTKFRFNLHVGDVGHTLVLGPTGAGKSVLLNTIEAQFLRYKDAQVYVFDKGGSAKVLTYGLGGNYHELGMRSELSFQPLRNIHKENEIKFASEWVLELLINEGVTITPKIKEELWVGLKSLASAPKEERTVFGLTVLLQNETLRKALLPFTVQGAHGSLLDSDSDTLSLSRFECFEMEALMETKSVVVPVLSYLFHRLEKRFTGVPTLLVLDEAWLFLGDQSFSKKIREWLKVLRKKNVSVIFATQSLSDVSESSISPVIKEACLTKIYLPNASAQNSDIKAIYCEFGLNEKQIEIISLSHPKRHYYYSSPLGNRLFELALDELTLSYVGATSKEAQERVSVLYRNTASVSEFNKEYLETQGISWGVEAIKALDGRKAT